MFKVCVPDLLVSFLLELLWIVFVGAAWLVSYLLFVTVIDGVQHRQLNLRAE
jgi:hypothetical protein